jgi:hypothetical protein
MTDPDLYHSLAEDFAHRGLDDEAEDLRARGDAAENTMAAQYRRIAVDADERGYFALSNMLRMRADQIADDAGRAGG